MGFITRRIAAEHQLDWRWADYIRLENNGAEDREERYYRRQKWNEYDIAKAVITGMGYWCDRDKNGKHKVVRRRFPRFSSYYDKLDLDYDGNDAEEDDSEEDE